MPIKMGLLALLVNGPAHGYELRQRFEDAAGGLWPLNIGQVYDSLKRLDRDGLVERSDVTSDAPDGRGGERRAYEITPAGRAEVERWLQEAVSPPSGTRDELAIRVLVAHATGADMETLLQRERESFMRRMQTLVRHKREAVERQATTEVLLVDLLELRLRADTEWLDLAERRLTTPTGDSR